MNIVFSEFDLRTGVRVPQLDDELLAYETGVHIGDGSLQIIEGGTHSSRYFGHSEDDWIFYSEIMPRIVKKLYNKEVKPTKRKDAKTCTLSICSMAVTTFKQNIVGLPAGNKNKMLEIPKTIKKDEKNLSSLVRGIADTDFSLFFHKKNGRYMDPEISCTMSNKALIQDIQKILENLGFTISSNYDVERVRQGKEHLEHIIKVCGGNQLRNWMKIIGFDNPKHKTKFLIWEKNGFCLPRQTTQERLDLISSF